MVEHIQQKGTVFILINTCIFGFLHPRDEAFLGLPWSQAVWVGLAPSPFGVINERRLMQRFYFLPLLFGLAIGLGGCQNNTPRQPKPQEKLFIDFFVRYLSDESQLKAQASFSEGISPDDSKAKQIEGGVAFQNSGMTEQNLQGKVIRYELVRSGDYTGNFPFNFKDEEGQQREYILKMSPIEDFFIKGAISKSKGMTLVVNGGLIKANEQLVLLFSDEDSRAYSITLSGPAKTIEFSLSPEQTAPLRPGPGQLYLVKRQDNIEENDEISLVSSIEYYTTAIDIEVIE